MKDIVGKISKIPLQLSNFLRLCLAKSKTFYNFTSLKQTTYHKESQPKGFISIMAKALYPHIVSVMERCTFNVCWCLSNGKGNALFMFAKVKSQPFNGLIVKSPNYA